MTFELYTISKETYLAYTRGDDSFCQRWRLANLGFDT